jgi:hypothetical protein
MFYNDSFVKFSLFRIRGSVPLKLRTRILLIFSVPNKMSTKESFVLRSFFAFFYYQTCTITSFFKDNKGTLLRSHKTIEIKGFFVDGRIGSGAGSVQVSTDLDCSKACKELSEICRYCTKKLTYVSFQF